jgi:hypothetical protein
LKNIGYPLAFEAMTQDVDLSKCANCKPTKSWIFLGTTEEHEVRTGSV